MFRAEHLHAVFGSRQTCGPGMNYQKIRNALIILACLIAIVVGSPCLLFPFVADRDWVPESATAKLQGASPDEVHELLGEPASIYPRPSGPQWVYRRGVY